MAKNKSDLAAALKRMAAQRDATATAVPHDLRATQADADAAARRAAIDSAGYAQEFDRMEADPSRHGDVNFDPMVNYDANRQVEANAARDSTARDAASRARDAALIMHLLRVQ